MPGTRNNKNPTKYHSTFSQKKNEQLIDLFRPTTTTASAETKPKPAAQKSANHKQ
jgi:hypothetical protein